MRRLLFAFVLSLLVASAAQAQGIYVIQGKNGPIFTDKPQAGAREVTLPPLNVTTSPTPAKSAKPAANAQDLAEVSPYRALSIVWPENEGSVVANTAIFEVRLSVDPALRLGDGHAFAVSLNGRAVNQRFTASEFMIPPEFWGDALPPPNQLMQLDASIVDGDGKVLKSATPVRFYLRHAFRN